MKLVFFTNRMTKGGSERVISYLANGLSDKYDVTILTMTCAKSDYYLSDKVKHIPLEDDKAHNNHSLIRNISRIIKLRNYICSNPEAIYLSFVTLPSYLLLFFRKKVRGNGRIIITVRNDPKQQHRHFYDKLLVKWLYPQADAFVFQTLEEKKYYSAIKIKYSEILPNPLNIQFIKQPFEGRRKKEIVNVGRLIEQKNQKLLIEAFKDVHKLFPEYHLSIYGDGHLWNDLQLCIKENALNGIVELKGSIPNLQDIIYDTSLFVLSSDFEGMPNALLEAMALGLPVISTKCSGGGPETIIRNGENGFLVKVGDKKELSKTIIEVLANPGLAKKLSNNASKIALVYSPEATLMSWEKFIKKVSTNENDNY